MTNILNSLINDDCFNVFPLIPDKSINLILCDLPYGTTACKWDTVLPLDKLWIEYKRILAPSGVVVLTASQPFTTALINSNPKWFRYELIWEKSQGTGFLNAKKLPLKNHENILIFHNGHPTYNPQMTEGKPYVCSQGSNSEVYRDTGKARPTTYCLDGKRYPKSVLKFKSDRGLHPTQKPVELFKNMILQYSNEGDTVLDNCAGVATTAIAAIETGRQYICIEMDKKYYDIGIERIKEAEAGRMCTVDRTDTKE